MTVRELLKEKFIKECMADTDAFAKSLEKDKYYTFTKLEGDASTRSYFRFSDSRDSLIIMKLNLGVKLPEEGFTGNKKQSESKLPFIDVYEYLSQFPLNIPKIYEYDAETGVLLLEDVGDELLQYYIADKDIQEIERIYKKAIDSLFIFQNNLVKNKDCIAFTRSFDRTLLNWEFNHFIEYALPVNTIREKDLVALREIFDDISKTLANTNQVFVHRDYHSRNLLVKNDTLYIIDFQDALLGPVYYDLASLLKDAYVHLDEDLIERLLNYFMEQKEIKDKNIFLKHFNFMALQRNLKAIGRFYFIDRVKKNPKFLQYIPNLIGNVKKILKKHKELKPINEIYTRYYEDYIK